MSARLPLFREALRLLGPLHVIAQIGLAVLVFLLSVLWLRLSDASACWLVITVVLGIIILLVAGAGEAAILLALTRAPRAPRTPRTPRKLLRGAVIVIALLALWFGWTVLLSHHGNDVLITGFLYSKLPRSLRHIFNYENLELFESWFWDAVAWIGTGILAALLLPLIASIRPLRAASCALRSASFWITLIAGTLIASFLTGELLQWTPGNGLSIEFASLIFRISLIALIDSAVACIFLALIAACVRRANAQPITPAGTPVASHPRTVPNP